MLSERILYSKYKNSERVSSEPRIQYRRSSFYKYLSEFIQVHNS